MRTTRLHRDETGAADTAGLNDRPALSRWQMAVGAAGLAAVLWAGNNLYDAISQGSAGPGGPGGPGGHGPPPGAPATPPADDPGTAPPSSDGHDPSQFDHG